MKQKNDNLQDTAKKNGQKKKMPVWKRVLSILGIAVGAVLLVVIGYFAYVFIDYHRLPDNMDLEIRSGSSVETAAVVGKEYSITTYNIGFGAYTQDYSFFMDGGTESVAESKASVIAMTDGAASYIKENVNPDFMFWQEIDLDSTRSYHVDQYEMVCGYFDTYDSDFALNYDSPFLFYPILQPHGKSVAGIATFSNIKEESGLRRSFPISTSLSKLVDLDRCYSITRIPVENGKYLVLINLHMSAYGSDASVREGQIGMLMEDMEKEYLAGNYVIAGGDFNHDLPALEDANLNVEWAHAFPRESLPAGFSFGLDRLDAETREGLHHSARNADEPYNPATTFTVTLDGFILSDNIEMTSYVNIDLQYLYSDHDPVCMKFVLK